MNEIRIKNTLKVKEPSLTSYALLNIADVHSDDDDDIVDKGLTTQAELKCVHLELLKSADNQSSFDSNILNQLQHTDLTIVSLELKIPEKNPVTSIFDVDPNKCHEFFAPKPMIVNTEILLKHQKTNFFPSNFRTWLINPSTPKFQRKILLLPATTH